MQRRPLPDPLEAMVDALLHRGPDGSGFYRTDGYFAGMRRLSINDVEGGDQPLYNEDKSVVLLYNGEIYNSPALRRMLEAEGHTFRTRSDGEVICHLYEKAAERCFEWLDGMFAVALWDERHRRLLLARDIPGEKPLYYAELPGNGLAFASELKSLMRYPIPDRSLNYQALWDFPTFLWIPEPETVYTAVRALMPGHVLVADDSGMAVRPYSFREADERTAPASEAGLLSRTRQVVEEAVQSRLLSDVPVGSFLSSGLDSSIIAAIAARELPELTTFTIGFEDIDDPYHGRADEADAAAAYAKRLGTKHHTIRVTAADFGNALPFFCDYGDQPFSVSSGLGILFVARAARRAGIKVLLSGDGADECFGGYSWYAHLNGRPEEYTQQTIAEGTSVSFQNVGMDAAARKAVLHSYDAHKRAWAWHYYASEEEKRMLFSPGAFAGSSSSLRFFRAHNPAAHWRPEDFVAQDRAFYFPNEMLRKVDRMTMACSVEGRAPFAAPKVLAFANTLDYSAMYREGTLKWALRRAFADLVPEDVLRRPKHGFNVPVDHWLRTGWSDLLKHSFSEESALRKHGLIHSKSGEIAQRLISDPSRLHGHTLFSYIMLNMWLERNT